MQTRKRLGACARAGKHKHTCASFANWNLTVSSVAAARLGEPILQNRLIAFDCIVIVRPGSLLHRILLRGCISSALPGDGRVCFIVTVPAHVVFLLSAFSFTYFSPSSSHLLVAVVFLHLFLPPPPLFFLSSILNPWLRSLILLLPSPIYLTPTKQMALRSSHKMVRSVFVFHGASLLIVFSAFTQMDACRSVSLFIMIILHVHGIVYARVCACKSHLHWFGEG